MAKLRKPKRHVFRIDITPQTVECLEDISTNLGITQIAITSKMIIWLHQQPAMIQHAILGMYPEVVGQAAGELVLRRMAGDLKTAPSDSR